MCLGRGRACCLLGAGEVTQLVSWLGGWDECERMDLIGLESVII